ncbi:hypothetical protein M9434_005623 [Picochlorum sp. BPE23]|nr:hypothetical protein M9434_005623 [Picochlorum sp. BPE23]
MPFTVEAMPFASSDVIPASAHVDSERSPKVSAGLSSSSLSTLDISLNFGASEFDTGTTRLIDDWNFETMCRQDQDSCPPRHSMSAEMGFPEPMGRPLDSVCEQSLQSFPWADFSIFSENDAKGSDARNVTNRTEHVPVDVEESNAKRKETKKRSRGPKPKYIYSSKEQAAAARKERNRQAALNSYYKRRQRIQDLEKEVDDLSKENSMLQKLLQDVQEGRANPLEVCSMEKIDIYLREHGH